ncbi:ABC transporter substrate-binding protein [Arthrobacter sp. H14-L1]|uniref:ABC transporter substrate-binding protein n=1 Tax=Arthrobacter sp. H14-L1 TaxID=2996697 RepID=UPI00226D79E5|nr:sugar ABC transporter substrate-binding protein [Arthrobacter sp. H14-L1]MCY0903319.1 sugar ABC transporter substrate-binding protein [Arthrobacter sp. H14-L1]
MNSITFSRRNFVAGALGVGALLATSACGGSAGGNSASQITWSTWGTPEEGQRFKTFNTAFKADNPSINATLQMVPSYSDYHSKLLTQLTSGTAPDVFYVGDDYLGKFVSAGVLMDLTPVVSGPDAKVTLADFNEALFGAGKTDKGIFALPNDCNPDVFWFDKKALAAAGITENPAELAAAGNWTIETFLAMCAKLAANGMTGAIFWNYWSTHWSWVTANGGEVFDSAGKFVLPQDPKSVAAIASLADAFANKSFTVADTLPDGSGADSLFVSHKAGFYVQGRYGIATAEQSGNKDDYDIAPWPTVSGKPGSSGVAASYLVINAKTKAPKTASTFVGEFLSSKGQTLRLADGGNAVPSVKGADSVVLGGNYPAHAKSFLDMTHTGFEDFSKEASVPGLSSDVSKAMLSMYQGKASAGDTIAAVSTLIEKAV